MPAARLTMDRFWTAARRRHAIRGRNSRAAPRRAAGIATRASRTPVSTRRARHRSSRLAANRQRIDRHDEVTVDAACSHFANSFDWQLAVPGGSGTRLAANGSTRSAFTPDRVGNYDLTLQVTGPQGDVATLTRYAFVENLVPVARRSRSHDRSQRGQRRWTCSPAASLGDPPVTVSIDERLRGSDGVGRRQSARRHDADDRAGRHRDLPDHRRRWRRRELGYRHDHGDGQRVDRG